MLSQADIGELRRRANSSHRPKLTRARAREAEPNVWFISYFCSFGEFMFSGLE